MKIERQTKILELIKEHPIETQQELAEKLTEEGFLATQATVSRDIKELRLVKSLGDNGKYHYVASGSSDAKINDRIAAVFYESVIEIDHSGHMVVIKTFPGAANAASVAIDSLNWDDIVGCLAGDDTIFVAIRNPENVEGLLKRFKKLMR
ncbi:MAG TPA: arginine repressor [Eubacteriaceae bacterium]|nr:arginine repressor [Eubacteriaceae bacterium]